MHLIACSACDRQYDVSRHEEGNLVRCTCGESLTVRHYPAHEPKLRRCPGCGAPLSGPEHSCSYCRVEFDPKEMVFTSLCPHCHARMSDDANFCMDCGKEIAPQFLVAIDANQSCPRCQAALVSRRVETTSLVECSGCMGLWIPVESFEATCQSAEKQQALTQGLALRATETLPTNEAPPPASFKYLPCLACGDLMVPRNFGGNSGIIIDVCGRHGVWLDEGELSALLRYIKSGKERLDGTTGSGLERKPISPDYSLTNSGSSASSSNSFVNASVIWVVLDLLMGFLGD